jgi:hypothetical protein
MALPELQAHATYAVRRLDEMDWGQLARWLGVKA